MHDFGARSAGRLEMTNGVGFTLALYVRDSFALPVAQDVPMLYPTVMPRRSPAPRGDVQTGWSRWWSRLSEAPPGMPLRPDHDERLAALWDQVEREGRQWESDHVRLQPMYLPSWPSQWLQDHVSPGAELQHATQVLGARGDWHLIFPSGRLLVSLDVYRDSARMDEVLRSALGQALQQSRD